MRFEYNSQNISDKIGCIQWVIIVALFAWMYPTYKRVKEMDKKIDNLTIEIRKLNATRNAPVDTTSSPAPSNHEMQSPFK